MAGLGLGALLVARSKRWLQTSLKTYGLLQWIIGFCAIVSIPLFRTYPAAVFFFIHSGWVTTVPSFMLIRFLVVFGFMLIPVTLMGMTLPVVVGASYKKLKSRYAYLAGKLYGINTLGAVFGTLAAGFLLIPALGILKTCVITGVVDLLMGSVLLWRIRHERTPGRFYYDLTQKKICANIATMLIHSPNALPPRSGSFSWPAAVFLLSGISALAYEIIWFRLLARIIGPSVHAFSVMLATYLLGLALGSLIGARIINNIKNHRLTLAVLLGITSFGPLMTLFFVNKLPIWYGMLFVRFTSAEFTYRNLILQGVMACILILPATLALGAFFPVVTRAYNKERGDEHLIGSVGHLYFYNTIGGVIGSLATGFWLVPALGMKSAIIVAGGLNIAMALAIYFAGFRQPCLKRRPMAALSLQYFSYSCLLAPE